MGREQRTLLTLGEVALRLNRTSRTVYCWRRRRGLPCYAVGRGLLFDWDQVMDWVRAGGNAQREARSSTAEVRSSNVGGGGQKRAQRRRKKGKRRSAVRCRRAGRE